VQFTFLAYVILRPFFHFARPFSLEIGKNPWSYSSFNEAINLGVRLVGPPGVT